MLMIKAIQKSISLLKENIYEGKIGIIVFCLSYSSIRF